MSLSSEQGPRMGYGQYSEVDGERRLHIVDPVTETEIIITHDQPPRFIHQARPSAIHDNSSMQRKPR